MVSSVLSSDEGGGDVNVSKQQDIAPGSYVEVNAGYLLRGRESQGLERIS